MLLHAIAQRFNSIQIGGIGGALARCKPLTQRQLAARFSGQFSMIDDVITDGASKFEAAAPLEQAGLTVKDFAIFLDREQGGAAKVDALVADVATGLDENGAPVALEEGVGQPTLIVVVLPNAPYRLAIGVVFTYYEFTVAPSNRMTDEAWQALVEAGTNPPAPGWTSLFIIP